MCRWLSLPLIQHTSNDLAEYRHHPSTHLDLYTLDASSVVHVIILTAAPPQDSIELLVGLIAKDESNVVVALVAVNKPRAGEVESAVCSWTWGRRNVLSVQKQQTYLCWGIPHQYPTAMFDNYGISSKKNVYQSERLTHTNESHGHTYLWAWQGGLLQPLVWSPLRCQTKATLTDPPLDTSPPLCSCESLYPGF